MPSTPPRGHWLRNPLVIVPGVIAIFYCGFLFGRHVRDWVN